VLISSDFNGENQISQNKSGTVLFGSWCICCEPTLIIFVANLLHSMTKRLAVRWTLANYTLRLKQTERARPMTNASEKVTK